MDTTQIYTYKIWTPDGAMWTQWVKPVLFTNFRPGYGAFNIAEIEFPNEITSASEPKDTAVIFDLPGKEGVEKGLALARAGHYRPIPLYNGVEGPNEEAMVVNVREIADALFQSANILSGLNLTNEAPPVFLLDSERMKGRGKQYGKYDNRWCVSPQDMPSASFLSDQGIKKVAVCAEDNKIQNDLSHISYRYQEQGVKIYLLNGKMRETKISKPSKFGSLSYRFKTILGLRRNATGGFGAPVPEATQYSGSAGAGYGYYRMG